MGEERHLAQELLKGEALVLCSEAQGVADAGGEVVGHRRRFIAPDPAFLVDHDRVSKCPADIRGHHKGAHHVYLRVWSGLLSPWCTPSVSGVGELRALSASMASMVRRIWRCAAAWAAAGSPATIAAATALCSSSAACARLGSSTPTGLKTCTVMCTSGSSVRT